MAKVKDRFGDLVEVRANTFAPRVSLWAYKCGTEGEHAYMSYEPSQARKLAKALRRAARKAEKGIL
jgi:hypothetical protein